MTDIPTTERFDEARSPWEPPTRDSSTRSELIEAGRKLFGQRGFDGASVRAITREADANLGAVTYHFGSKRALYSAVLEQGLRPMAARVRSAASSGGTALERILRVVEAYFDHFETHPDLPHLLLQEIAAGKQPPPVVLEIIRGVRETISGLQIEGEMDGSLRPGDPVLTALSVVSQPIFMTLVAPMLRTVGPFDLRKPEARRKALEHTLAFVRAGLEPREDFVK
jgi:AcrR family transcriptional regulator